MRTVVEKDFEEIDTWLEKWSKPITPHNFYPKTGLMIPGIAAGFLILTDASIGILENFVSNPDSQVKDRKEAIEAIAVGLEKIAKEEGLSHVCVYTAGELLRGTCWRLGYEDVCQSVLMRKELKWAA